MSDNENEFKESSVEHREHEQIIQTGSDLSCSQDTNYIENNIEKIEISCPLGKELEYYYYRISEITAIIHYLLKNIKS